jgi:hypothetical protein
MGQPGPMDMGCMDDGPMHFNSGQFPQDIGEDLSCSHCGYTGCARCGWGLGSFLNARFNALASRLRPYGEAGIGAQRWFDISAEAMVLRRTKGAGDFAFSSQGAGPGNIVLSTNDVDLDRVRAGLALQANIQTGPGSNLEAVYFGLNKWNESATVLSSPAGTPTLFSFISDFGTDPINGFDDPDRSFSHSLRYDSAIHNGEVNFRRRWVGRYGWLQGSWLAGIRYFDLDERMVFSARGQNNDTFMSNGLRFFDYTTDVRNELVGFQLGGDLWFNIIPGVNAGVEYKGGVFGNHSEQSTNISANSLVGFNEAISDGRTAYLGQLSLMGVYRLSYHWAFKGSYQLIYVDNVALAAENFNAEPPALFLPNSQRTVQINNEADILYQGYTLGAEYTW